jgi:glutaredoxin
MVEGGDGVMKITVYSKSNCLQSKRLIRYLSKRGIFFINKDITASEENLIEYEQYGYTSTPVCVLIDDGSEFEHAGFDEDVKGILDMIL